jgi:Flp pilus assembly protein TadB
LAFVFALAAFGAVFFLLLGIYSRLTRSHIQEFLAKKRQNTAQHVFILLSRYVMKVVGARLDGDRLDATVRLAGNPWGLSADTYPGAMFSLAAAGALAGTVIWSSGGPAVMIAILPLAFWGVPRILVYQKAERGRLLLRVELYDFYSRLEQAVAGGLSPERAFERAAEGRGILPREIGYVVDAVKYGTPLHQAFVAHFGEKLGIPEAGEIGTVLRNALVMGIPLSGPIHDLNREFRSRRQMDLYIRATKIKPFVDMVLTVTAIAAVCIIVVLPLLLNLWMSSLGGGRMPGIGG